MLLLVSLRGNIFLYQGDELGLPQSAIPFANLKDPEAIANWPRTLGRDGARTPMPWIGALEHAGFTSGEPWLVIGAGHAALAVDLQQERSRLTAESHAPTDRCANAAPLCARALLRFVEVSAHLLAFERNCRASIAAVRVQSRPERDAVGNRRRAIRGASSSRSAERRRGNFPAIRA
jgi:alpha-glucosidase